MSGKTRRGLRARRRGSSCSSWPSISAARRRSRELAKLTPQDVRAFMAARRADGTSGRSLMRALAGVRSFARFLEKNGKGKVGALAAVRAPKVPKTLPKPLADRIGASASPTPTCAPARSASPGCWRATPPCWRCSTASGLRISEALGLKRGDMPAPGKGDAITVTGKGNKQRMVPVLPQVAQLIADYVALCPYDLPADGRCSSAPRGGPLSPRIVQLAMERLRGALGLPDSATPHALAAFVRHASAGARRRPARHPGTARPRLAVHHADLHGGGYRAPARGLPQRAPEHDPEKWGPVSKEIMPAGATAALSSFCNDPPLNSSFKRITEGSAMSHGVHAVQHEVEHKIKHDEHGHGGGGGTPTST